MSRSLLSLVLFLTCWFHSSGLTIRCSRGLQLITRGWTCTCSEYKSNGNTCNTFTLSQEICGCPENFVEDDLTGNCIPISDCVPCPSPFVRGQCGRAITGPNMCNCTVIRQKAECDIRCEPHGKEACFCPDKTVYSKAINSCISQDLCVIATAVGQTNE